jgi:6-phosphofructokinase 1
VRVATRTAITQGFRVLAAEYGLEGLLAGQIRNLGWMDVTGWMSRGGSELGAGYYILQEKDLATLDAVLKQHNISAMMLIGGSSVYKSAHLIASHLDAWPDLARPTIVVPASINNNLPGTEFSVGADTALNNIVSAVDKIKDNAGSNRRLFIVQVMGFHSGYLAVVSGLASGAEDVFIPEEGITLKQIVEQVRRLRESFAHGRRLSVIILNEVASEAYDVNIIQRIMEEEGGDVFDVRSIILGHIQRGGAPTPFDRVLAARLAAEAVNLLSEPSSAPTPFYTIGLHGDEIASRPLDEAMKELDWPWERPQEQWFMPFLSLVREM